MSFRRSGVGLVALAATVAACSSAPLPEIVSPDPADPRSPTASASYQPVLAGTAAHGPAVLKSWRELNESVAPNDGRSP
jgi:hypothetical protein